MKLTGNTILITGGTSGIGLALARRLAAAGNTVLVCGRSAAKIAALRASDPQLRTYACDVGTEADRLRLFAEVIRDFPALNILFNNAGMQTFPALDGTAGWEEAKAEIATNLEAPIHLAMLFAGHLAGRPNAAILNTTSGLAHVPLAVAPVYSATKAALHSFTLSLRYQFRDKPIRVIEVSPPHVETDLGAPGANKAGMNLDAYADSVMQGLKDDVLEITTGFSTLAAQGSRADRDKFFREVNSRITQGKTTAAVPAGGQ